MMRDSLSSIGTPHEAMDTPPRGVASASVVIPTTAGIVSIEYLKPRPRLKKSSLVPRGNFEPMAMSNIYDALVSGPLLGHLGITPPYELCLSEEFDSGRSWQLGATIAHLLEQKGTLAAPLPPAGNREGGNRGDDGGGNGEIVSDRGRHVIWASGKVDADLRPLPDDYQMARKCETSAQFFDDCGRRGLVVHLVVPAGLPGDDVTLLETTAARHGFTLHEVGNLTDVDALLRATSTDDPASPPGPARVPPDSSQVIGQSPPGDDMVDAPARFRLRNVMIIIASPLAIIALSIFLIGSQQQSPFAPNDPHVQTPPTQPAPHSARPELRLWRLEARDRADCIARAMAARAYETTPVVPVGGRFSVPITAGLCGLRFENPHAGEVRLELPRELEQVAIAGSRSMFQGARVARNESIDLLFARPPGLMRTNLGWRSGKEARQTVPLWLVDEAAGDHARNVGGDD